GRGRRGSNARTDSQCHRRRAICARRRSAAVNATERAALIQGLEFYDEMTGTVGARTLEILDRRRRTAVVHRRGWLVRRLLVVADIAGLLVAFVLVAAFARRHGPLVAVDPHCEI